MHRCRGGGSGTIADTVIAAPMVGATVSTAPRKNVAIRARALKSSKHDDADAVADTTLQSDMNCFTV
jgi:hypothetical protein